VAELVYALCAVASVFSAGLLVWNYRRTRLRLALWTSLCFVGLAANNLLLFVDLAMVPEVDLSMWRNLTGIGALVTLLVGLIWEGP
jgi:hydrogenase/urease accessory protein HupE